MNFKLDYHLPVSRIVVAGTTTTQKNKLTGIVATRYDSAVDLAVSADHRTACTFEAEADRLAKTGLKLSLSSDGRLLSGQASFESGQATRLATIAKVGSFVGAGVLLAGGALPLALGAGAAAGLGTMLATRTSGVEGAALAGGDAGSDAADALAVEYVEAFPIEAALLKQLRAAQVALLQRIAGIDTASTHDTLSLELRNLSRALRHLRKEATPFESHYSHWAMKQVETTVTKRTVTCYVDELHPSLEELRAALTDDAHWSPAFRACVELRVVLTCAVHLEVPARGPSPQTVAGEVVFRPPVWATVSIWNLVADDSGHLIPILDTERLVLVTHPRFAQKMTLLAPNKKSDRSVDATFHEEGGISSLTIAHKGDRLARAEALGALPEQLISGAKAAADLAPLLSVDAARAAALKQQIDRMEAEQKLSGILYPATDRLAGLRAELDEATVRAAIAEAQSKLSELSTSTSSETVG